MIDLKSLLQEEKNLGKNPYYSYKVSSLQSINDELVAIKSNDKKEEARQNAITMEYDNPDSIVLNFVAGRINFLLNPHEAQIRLNNMMNTFHEKNNPECAEFIAAIILADTDTPAPLRVMGEIAGDRKDEAKMWEYYERYVKCNSKDTEIIVRVADNYEANGNRKMARVFYQRSLNRLLSASDSVRTREVYSKLIENGSSDFSFLSSYVKKLGNTSMAFDCAKLLLDYLYGVKDSFGEKTTPAERRINLENIINVSRIILSIRPAEESREMTVKSQEVKEKLVEVLKDKYGKSSRFPEVSKKFDILNSKDPVKTLDEFQKNIAFSKNTFVLQNATKRVGLITDVSAGGLLTVKFSTRAGDSISISIPNAMTSLTALSNQDIRAIKKGIKAEDIKKKIFGEGGREWLLKTLLFSTSDKTSTIKEMKEVMVPSVLKDSEWEGVAKELKQIAINDPYIDIINKSTYHLSDYPSSIEERYYETFQGYKEFGKKVSAIMEAISIPDFDVNSDSMLDMVKYFSDYLKDERNDISTRIESLLVIEYMSEKNVPVAADISFEELYKPLDIAKKKEVYENLSCKDSRKLYVDLLTNVDKNPYSVLESIFPINPTKELMNKLRITDKKKFKAYKTRCLSDFRENTISYGFFIECGVSAEDLKELKISEDDFVMSELNCLSSLYRGDNYDDRLVRALRSDLIENKRLEKYITGASQENLKGIASHLLWNSGLAKSEKDQFKAIISSRFPSFDFGEKKAAEDKPVEISVQRGFMCTKASFDRMQAELIDIKENQIPHTLHEIKTARELGDLRENSEYQYAKEHKIFLDREYERLAMELSSVKIMSVNDVLEGRVGFGTKVMLRNNGDGKEIQYTFFGRWESNPDENIIDINAPIGEALINHQAGEEVSFTLAGKNFSYTILSIEKVQF